MLEVFGKLFGTNKAAESLIDNTSNALDKLWYTDEEKAEDRAKSASEARTMVIDWLKATQGQNLSRRIIALTVTSMWSFMIMSMVFLSVWSVWEDPEFSDKLLGSVDAIGKYFENATGAMMLVLAFYFGAPYMGGIIDAAMKKFTGGKS